MDSLLDVLGRTNAADDIFRNLVDRRDCWISGPSGSGKTELARHLAAKWEETAGDVIWIVGDRDQAGTNYLAAHRALAARRGRRSVREADRDFPTAVLRAIPMVGHPLSALVRSLIARTEIGGPDFLSSDQQDLLAGFQQTLLSQSILLIVDNVHWLDKNTAELLHRMRSPEIVECYPFAGRSRLLVLQTSDQPPLLAAETLSTLKSPLTRLYELDLPTRETFPLVLAKLGCEHQLHAAEYDRLFRATRGHLKLAKEIVRILQENDQAEKGIGIEVGATVEEMALKLLRIRLDALPAESSQVQKLLQIAACIGETFSRSELECAFSDASTFTAILDRARSEEYVSGDGETLQFVHEIIRKAVRSEEGKFDAYHEKLGECIRILRPGDYRSRLVHAIKAGKSERAESLALATFLQEVRGGTDSIDVPEAPKSDALGPLAPMFDTMRTSLRHMDAGRHKEALRLLVPFYSEEPTLPQGELTYLIALNYFKMHSRVDYEKSRAILEPWTIRRDEGELWYRLMLTLAVVYTSLRDNRSSVETLTQVRKYLEAARHDPSARAKIQILNRKAEIFYPLEIAGTLIARSAEYFAPLPGSTVPRNAFQYCASLINLSGNLFVRGEFGKAAEFGEQSIRYITELSARLRVPEPYKAINNYTIAAFRGGLCSAQECLGLLEPVANSLGGAEKTDHSLLAINMAAFCFLSGDIAAADARLQRVYSNLKDMSADGYYMVYAAANWAVTRCALGQDATALALLDEADADAAAVSSETVRAFKMRHEAIRRAVRTGERMSPDGWDGFPQSVYGADGPHVSWASIGRGLLLSDIQVWSET
jgi:hypothetical protein